MRSVGRFVFSLLSIFKVLIVSAVSQFGEIYLGEIFFVMKKSSKSGILLVSVGQYVDSYVVR